MSNHKFAIGDRVTLTPDSDDCHPWMIDWPATIIRYDGTGYRLAFDIPTYAHMAANNHSDMMGNPVTAATHRKDIREGVYNYPCARHGDSGWYHIEHGMIYFNPPQSLETKW